ncbi:MAG: hypothetical protein OHK0015_01560 [Chloroflexi bacterium OHK40]
MPYPVAWDVEAVRSVLTTESRQKARELFMRTHRPFRRIRVDFCKEAELGGGFIGEEDVYALIAGGPLEADNRLFLVIGEAGAGKSELCQWLEYRADPARRLAIYVPRSMTSAAHVAALLRRALGVAGTPVLRRTPVATQARHIALTATVLLYEQGDPALSPTGAWEALLDSQATRAAIAEHLAAAARGDTRHELLAGFEILGPKPSLDSYALAVGWPALRRLVAQAMEQALWLGDLRETLRQISEAALASGVRPLLLLEDITAFRILGDRLLDYLLDLTSGHFDAVIGATTGFERTQMAGVTLAGDLTHIHHRLRARLVLTDDQGRAYGLDDDLIDLTRGYLSAIRGDRSLPPEVSACDGAFGDGLYPFTETALHRALTALHEEGSPRQTPRLFLEHVLGAALLSAELPPVALDRSAYLVSPPALFRPDDVPEPSLRSLLRWYGHISDDSVTLDRRIAEVWGVPVPPELQSDGVIRVARAYVAPSVGASVPSAPDWQQELRELQGWLDRGGLYPSRETLKRGVERALFALGDPRVLASPDSLSVSRAELIYARGDERIPVALARGSGDQPVSHASPKVVVRGYPEERGILEELAYLALSGAELGQICQNLALTLEWAGRHFDAYQAHIRGLLAEQLGGLTAEHLILAAWRLLSALRGEPVSGPPDLRADPDAVASYAARSPWSETDHWSCHTAGAELMACRETFRRLYIGSFTLRDTLLDRARLDRALADFDPDRAVATLSELPLASLRSAPFRVRPTGERLYGLLVPLQRYAIALRRADVATWLRRDVSDLTARARHLDAQLGLDLAELRRQLGALRWRCGEVGAVWREGWDAAVELLAGITPEELHALRDTVAAALGAAREAGERDVWAYQRFRHAARPALESPYWAAVGAVGAIQAELLRAARARYRAVGKSITGTAAYRALLRSVRAIYGELGDG